MQPGQLVQAQLFVVVEEVATHFEHVGFVSYLQPGLYLFVDKSWL